MLPAHARALTETGAMAEDDEEAQALWERLQRNGYDADDFTAFRDAYQSLCLSVVDVDGSIDYHDTLALVYESWAGANENVGQFFTPWSVCEMMAQVAAGNIREELRDRIVAAIGRDAIEGMGYNPDLPYTLRHIAETLLPHYIAHYDPITVCDPAVGSGSMLLAVAKLVPDWANQWGLVHYYGQDIDHTAHLMASVNLMLRGMNGYGLQIHAACSGLRLIPANNTPPASPTITIEAGATDLFGTHIQGEAA